MNLKKLLAILKHAKEFKSNVPAKIRCNLADIRYSPGQRRYYSAKICGLMECQDCYLFTVTEEPKRLLNELEQTDKDIGA